MELKWNIGNLKNVTYVKVKYSLYCERVGGILWECLNMLLYSSVRLRLQLPLSGGFTTSENISAIRYCEISR